MKYWEVKPGDWFYFDGEPYIKVEETDGTTYNIHLGNMNFGKMKCFIKPEDEVSFCSTLDYVYPVLLGCGKDVRATQADTSPLDLPYIPLSRVWENEIIVIYKHNLFWMYAIIYNNAPTQGKAFLISNLKAKDFYRYKEFHRTFPEKT